MEAILLFTTIFVVLISVLIILIIRVKFKSKLKDLEHKLNLQIIENKGLQGINQFQKWAKEMYVKKYNSECLETAKLKKEIRQLKEKYCRPRNAKGQFEKK